MRLLLDECIGHRSLRDALICAGHDVARSVDVLGGGADDLAVLTFACESQRIVVTYNNADFKSLADQMPKHPGMLLVYQDNRPGDMTTAEIVRAVTRVAELHADGIARQVVSLNAYRW